MHRRLSDFVKVVLKSLQGTVIFGVCDGAVPVERLRREEQSVQAQGAGAGAGAA